MCCSFIKAEKYATLIIQWHSKMYVWACAEVPGGQFPTAEKFMAITYDILVIRYLHHAFVTGYSNPLRDLCSSLPFCGWILSL